MPQITESTRWVVAIRPDVFHEIKTGRDFCSLVALARVVNTLHFVHQPLMTSKNDDRPAGTRTRYNSLLFTCALFAEATKLTQGMHKVFGTNQQFQKMAATTNTKEAREVLTHHLWKVRKKLVFHFDVGEIQQQMSTLDLHNPIFVSCLGSQKVNTYNELADVVALRILFGSEFPKDHSKALSLTKTITAVVLDFLVAAEEFMVDILTERKWTELQVTSE